MKKLFIAIIGLAAILLSPILRSAPILDQSHTSAVGTYGCLIINDCNWQQEVLTGITGTLDSVSIMFRNSGQIRLDLFNGSPLQGGSTPFTTTVDFIGTGDHYVDFDVSGLGFDVTAGTSFTMSIWEVANGAAVALSNNFGYAGNLGIDRGASHASTADCFNNCGFDMIFNTYVATSVPEPSILALFAAGLFGIGFARRRQS